MPPLASAVRYPALEGIGANPAVVLGLNPNALASVRALARNGVPVVTIAPAHGGWKNVHGWMAAGTRFARQVTLSPDTWIQELPEVLLECARHWSGRAVVIPSGDGEVEVLQAHREELSPFYHITLPDAELTTLYADKSALGEYARERGVHAPRMLTGLSPDELHDRLGEIRLPCIVKPPMRNALWDRRFAGRKALDCATSSELLESFRTAYTTHPNLIVQETIPGGDDRLVFSHIFVGADGRELALWTGHKVRQLPIHFGTSACARTRWSDEVADLTRRLLTDTGFVGYASVEFKVDERDALPKVIEITAGRTWYPHGLGVAAGVNIPLIWYRDALGLPPSPPAVQRDGVVWIDEVRDVYAAADYVRAGELTWSQWLRSLHGSRAYAHCAWDDPVPGLRVGVRLAASLIAGVRRQFTP
jgi:D-aspartate ligase